MAHPTPSRPTDGELTILRVLWQHGGRTVAEIRSELAKAGDVSHGSIQVRLQIMLEKGYVGRDERARPHVYYARVTEEHTKHRVLRDVVDRLFGGSAKNLVMHMLGAEKATAEELSDIRKRLDELDAEK